MTRLIIKISPSRVRQLKNDFALMSGTSGLIKYNVDFAGGISEAKTGIILLPVNANQYLSTEVVGTNVSWAHLIPIYPV